MSEEIRLLGKHFVNSCVVRLKPQGEVIVVVEANMYSDGRTDYDIRTIKNPKRSYYLTKPQFRNHTLKKEHEEITKLDRYICYNHDMIADIWRSLNPGKILPRNHTSRNFRAEVLASPYLYAAGVDIQTLLKIKYKDDAETIGLPAPDLPTGFFDIETSMFEDNKGEILCIANTHENICSLAVQRRFLEQKIKGKSSPADVKKLIDMTQRYVVPQIDKIFTDNAKSLKEVEHKRNFEFEFYIAEDEGDLLRWTFGQIHRFKTILLGIWNMNFDVPAILRACERNNIDPAELFCDPDVPEYLKYVNYKEDVRKNVAHFTDRWHWMMATSRTQFFDYMALYAKNRTISGKEPSYKLDHILLANNVGGKMKELGITLPEWVRSEADWHRYMQENHPYEYCIYCMGDVCPVQVMEWINRDAITMFNLSDYSSLSKFPRQTVKACDMLYHDWIPEGKVLGTTSTNMVDEYDHLLVANGGAVLPPGRIDKIGLKILREFPNIVTRIFGATFDEDLSSQYPTMTQVGNISKDTQIHTVLYIRSEVVQKRYSEREAVEVFYSFIIHHKSNGIAIGQEFCGLPGVSEMTAMLDAKCRGEDPYRALAAFNGPLVKNAVSLEQDVEEMEEEDA